jgi:uncharacterized membrane protein
VLLVAIAVVLLAMQIAPGQRDVLAYSALLPMSLYEFASWSADAPTIVFAWLFTSTLVRPPARRWVAPLCGLAVGLCKPAYFLLSLLCLVTKVRARDRVAILAATAVGTVLSLAAAQRGAYNPRPELPVDARAQIRCVAADPMRYIRIATRDVTTNGRFYVEEMVGRFGANEVKLPVAVTTAELLLLGFVVLTGGRELAPRGRTMALSIVLATVAGILLSQYLIWSVICGDAIEGVQGRYFLELLPLFVAAIALPAWQPRWRHGVLLAVAIVCNAVALQTLLYRYWS